MQRRAPLHCRHAEKGKVYRVVCPYYEGFLSRLGIKLLQKGEVLFCVRDADTWSPAQFVTSHGIFDLNMSQIEEL